MRGVAFGAKEMVITQKLTPTGGEEPTTYSLMSITHYLRSAHPKVKNIFCYCSLLVCIGLSGPNTLPKWNIFCYCSLLVCIGLSGPNTLPKWNIFFIVACCMYWPFRTTTPSQSAIFSVIVACWYVLAFQDQTPSQSEIFSVIIACLYVLAFQDHNTFPKCNIFCYLALVLYWPFKIPKWNIFCIVACLYVFAFQDQTPSQSEHPPKVKYFLLCSIL